MSRDACPHPFPLTWARPAIETPHWFHARAATRPNFNPEEAVPFHLARAGGGLMAATAFRSPYAAISGLTYRARLTERLICKLLKEDIASEARLSEVHTPGK